MSGFTMDNILLLLVGLGLLMLVIKFLKGIFKAIIAIVLILTVGVSAYNIFIAKKPISYEINRYKTDFVYAKELKSISSEAYKAVDEIKENKAVNENINILMALREKANLLDHSEEANFIHDRYMNSLDGVILAAKGYVTAKGAEEQINKLEGLTKELNIRFIDVIMGEDSTS